MNIKKDFPLLSSDIVYLDSAATAQKPKVVIDRINEYYNMYNANTNRGAYQIAVDATSKLEDTRKSVKEFINARYSEEIIFTKNATECSNLIAYSYGLNNLDSDDEVVLSIMEHHSNMVPWQYVTKRCKSKLKYMYINDNYTIDKDMINNTITDKTKIVCITYMSNVLGVINDVKSIIDKAHSVGAKVIVDASQAIAHKKIDVIDLDADFLFFSSHKMMGPLGVGVLYGKKELLDNMPPFLFGGDMIEYVTEEYATYAPLPNKFEAGTQNIGDIIALKDAIEYINNIGFDNIEKYDNELTRYLKEELSKLDYITTYYPLNNDNHTSVVSFNINGIHPHEVSTILDTKNICIRTGNHCAQPLMRYLGINSTCRISLFVYNNYNDIDRLIEGIKYVYETFKPYIKEVNND